MSTRGPELLLCFLAMSSVFSCAAVSETLIGSRESCTNEGGKVAVNSIKNMRCFTCMCRNGFVECQREGCPGQQGCYMLLEQEKGQCCQECKGCVWEGVERPSGAEWVHEGEPCRVMRCLGGVVTETQVVCHTPCQSPLPPKAGECCPACRGCLINGQEVGPERDATIPDDPCLKCHCGEEGNGSRSMTCTKIACPVLQCPASKRATVPGECCPVCKGSRPVRTPPQDRCVLVSEVRKQGESFSQTVVDPGTSTKAPIEGAVSPGNCTQCRCGTNGTVHCLRETCPVFECPPERRVWPIEVSEDGTSKWRSCCMKCLEERAEARKGNSCIYEGVVHKEGERWALDACRSCVCLSGSVRCAVEMCPATAVSAGRASTATTNAREHRHRHQNTACPPNTRLQHPEGTCCPSCVESDGVCSVFGDPHYRTFDGRFYSFQGACKYLLASDQCGSSLQTVDGSGESSGSPSPPSREEEEQQKHHQRGTTQELARNNGTFSIRVTNDARGTFASSWTRTISIKAHGLKVSLGQKMRVKVNGKKVVLPMDIPGNATMTGKGNHSSSLSSSSQTLVSVRKEGGTIVLWLHPGIVVAWDGTSFLEVSLPTAYKNNVCGLCGNYNGDPKDDLMPRSAHQPFNIGDKYPSSSKRFAAKDMTEKGVRTKFGNVASNSARVWSGLSAFASSWRVGGRKACSRPEGGGAAAAWPSKGRLKRIGHASPARRRRPFPPLNPPLPTVLCRGRASVGTHGSLQRRRRKMRERYDKCRSLRSATFSACHEKVDPNMYIRSCLSDLCECPKGARCHCSSLKAYAHACGRAILHASVPTTSTDTLPPPSPSLFLAVLPAEVANWWNATGCVFVAGMTRREEDGALAESRKGKAVDGSPSSREGESKGERERVLRQRRRMRRRRRRRRLRKRMKQQKEAMRRRQQDVGGALIPSREEDGAR